MPTRTATATGTTKRMVRWAALPTFPMALFNVPAGPGAGNTDIPAAVCWLATAVGLAGLIAAVALLRRVSWGVPAVAAVAVLNMAGGVTAMVAGWDGGPVGLVLGLAALVLVAPGLRRS